MVNYKATVLAAGLLVLGSAANAATCSNGNGFAFGRTVGCYSSSVGGHSVSQSSFYSVLQRLMNIHFGGSHSGSGLSWVAQLPGGSTGGQTPPVSEVPLPASALLLLGGLGGLAFARSRKKI